MNDDLENLTHMAAQADAGATEIDAAARGPEKDADGNEIVPAAPTDFQREAAGAVDMFAALVVGFAPKAEPIWTAEAKARTAAALAPVLEKYGFTFGNMPPEVTLAIVAGPLLWQSSKIVAEQAREQKRIAAPSTPEPAQVTDRGQEEKPDNPTGPEVPTHPQMGLYKR